MATAWRTAARDLSMLFCAALVSYLVWVLLAARLGVWLVAALPGGHSLPVRLLLGTVVLDLSKAPALLLLALALRRLLSIRPALGAVALLGFCYGLELLTTLAVGQTGGFTLPVLLSRLGAVALLFAAARWVLARRAATYPPAAS